MLVPVDQSEDDVLKEATDNIVQLLEYAIDYPELLPSRHDLIRPVFDEVGLLYKENVSVTVTPKPIAVI